MISYLPAFALIFALSLAVSLVVTPLARRLGEHRDIADRPGGRRQHRGVIPRLGGIALYAGFTAAVLATILLPQHIFPPSLDPKEMTRLLGLLSGTTAVFIFGLLDDRYEFPSRPQYIAQFLSALIALAFIDIDTQLLPDSITLPLLWLGLLISLDGWFATTQEAILGAALEEAGAQVRVLDLVVHPYSEPLLADLLEEFRPQIAGITAVTMTVDHAMGVLAEIKRLDPRILTVMGGPHVSFSARETLQACPALDIAVIGEGERTIVELARAAADGSDLAAVAGIALRVGETVCLTARREFIADLDRLPPPARHLLPLGRYRALGMPISMTTTRGCPHRCVFCTTPAAFGPIRCHSVERVLDEAALVALALQGQAILGGGVHRQAYGPTHGEDRRRPAEAVHQAHLSEDLAMPVDAADGDPLLDDTHLAAQQIIDRHAQGLALDVPQGDIDAADGLDVCALLAEIARSGIVLFPDARRLARIAPQEMLKPSLSSVKKSAICGSGTKSWLMPYIIPIH